MPKDTKSSGYNKAPACESRGFGHKKEGENFDTPSFWKRAEDGTRTRDPNLGKVMLYQLSYFRKILFAQTCVLEAGLEPAQPQWPKDFKSVCFEYI